MSIPSFPAAVIIQLTCLLKKKRKEKEKLPQTTEYLLEQQGMLGRIWLLAFNWKIRYHLQLDTIKTGLCPSLKLANKSEKKLQIG